MSRSLARGGSVQLLNPADRLTSEETDSESRSGEASVGSTDKNKQANSRN